ncbi:unnamed protein product [Discosporangium mesarthrocarpum]
MLMKVVKGSFTAIQGTEPELLALHAGLECGVIRERSPGMDMVSFGPTIHGAHSPDERVQISTVEPFWNLILATLARLAQEVGP